MNHADYGNQLILKPKDRPQAEKSIGQEDVKIPIFINSSLRHASKRLIREPQATAICQVTGISIEIIGLTLPLSLEYENPIGKLENAMKIASLSERELSEQAPEILAGIILSIGHSFAAFDHDKRSTEQKNAILSRGFSVSCLVEAIKKMKRMVESRKASAGTIPGCFISENFPLWLEDSFKMCFPIREETKKAGVEIEPKERRKRPIEIKTCISKIQKLEAKELISTMKANGELSAENSTALQYFVNHSMTPDQKGKYMFLLADLESTESETLLFLLSLVPTIKEQELGFEEEAEVEVAKSLSDSLAEWKKRKGASK